MSVRKRDDRGGAWWVDFTYRHPDGRSERIRRASPVNTRQGAEKYEAQLRARLMEHGSLKDGTTTLDEFSREWFRISAGRLREGTLTITRSALSRPAVAPLLKMGLGSIGPKELADVYAGLVATMKVSSANTVMGRIRAVLSGAVEWGYIKEVPKVRKMRETRRENTDFLTFDEASRLLAACAPGDIGSPYVWLALRAGLRVGEIRGLVWGDWDGRRLNVSRQVTKEGRVTGTKSGKGRSVPVPDDLKEYLDGARNGAPDSAPIAYRGSATEAASALARLLRAAGISREGSSIGMHDLRHTYASHLAMKGVSLQVIQRLLGHADISMTQRYAHLLQGAVDEAVQVLSPARHQ